ncbi:MAG: LysR family transcriptional regulator [Pseudomonadota bacterium]
MHLPDPQTLRLFLRIAELRSFAAAGRELGLSPPAVTRAIGRLEQDLGVQLFVRTTRAVSLTADGAQFAETVSPILLSLEQAVSEMRSAEGALTGRLRLSVPVSFGNRVLPEILGGFRMSYPSVQLSVSMTDELIDLPAAPVDLAVRISGPPRDTSTIWRKICRVERVLVCAARAPEASLEDLALIAPERRLGYGSGASGETWSLSCGAETRRIRAGSHVLANNGEMLASLAARGDGVTLLPRFIVSSALEAGELVEMASPWTPDPLWLTLFYPPYDRLPPTVAAFSDFFERAVLQEREDGFEKP